MFKFVRIIHNAIANTLKTKMPKLFRVYNTINIIKIFSISDYQGMDTAVRWLPKSILYFPLINKTPVLLAAVQLAPQGEIAFPFFTMEEHMTFCQTNWQRTFMHTIFGKSIQQRPKVFLFLCIAATISSLKTRVSHRRTEDHDFLALKACHANKRAFYFLNSS